MARNCWFSWMKCHSVILLKALFMMATRMGKGITVFYRILTIIIVSSLTLESSLGVGELDFPSLHLFFFFFLFLLKLWCYQSDRLYSLHSPPSSTNQFSPMLFGLIRSSREAWCMPNTTAKHDMLSSSQFRIVPSFRLRWMRMKCQWKRESIIMSYLKNDSLARRSNP